MSDREIIDAYRNEEMSFREAVKALVSIGYDKQIAIKTINGQDDIAPPGLM